VRGARARRGRQSAFLALARDGDGCGGIRWQRRFPVEDPRPRPTPMAASHPRLRGRDHDHPVRDDKLPRQAPFVRCGHR
jgi:hypothetical protein